MPGKKTSSKKVVKKPIESPFDTTREFERLLNEAPVAPHYVLRLYITGSTPRSMAAIANIRALCDQHLAGRYELEVVDIYQQPQEAFKDQIIAAPTLVKELPSPPTRMVGNLANIEKILLSLNITPKGSSPAQAAETKWLEL